MQIAVASLPAKERFKHKNLMLAGLTRASVYKKHGISRVLAGIDPDGTRHDEPNLAADLRRLDEGVLIQIPDDRTGGMRTVRLKAWVLVVCADYLAAQSMLPFFESCGAHMFCRGCDLDKSEPDAMRPFSFLRRPADEQDMCCAGEGKRQRKSRPTHLEHLECSLQPSPPGCFTKKLSEARGNGIGVVAAGEAALPRFFAVARVRSHTCLFVPGTRVYLTSLGSLAPHDHPARVSAGPLLSLRCSAVCRAHHVRRRHPNMCTACGGE